MSDYFGYNKETQANKVVSSDNAIINVGKGQLGLVQQFNGTYSHQVEPRYEMGSSTLYWIQGKPSGQFQVSKLVGEEGILEAFKGDEACGDLRQLSVDLGGGTCSVGSRAINFSGAKLQSVSVNGNVGGLDIAESATFVVAEME